MITFTIILVFIKKRKTMQTTQSDHFNNWIKEWTISSILPGLYLGNIKATDEAILNKYKIRNVVTASVGKCVDSSKYKNLYLGWYDTPCQLLFRYGAIDSAYHFIDLALTHGENVLVHCQAGVSRSAIIVIYYLMRKFNMPYKVARKYVGTQRPIINPNHGFVKQLLRYENM